MESICSDPDSKNRGREACHSVQCSCRGGWIGSSLVLVPRSGAAKSRSFSILSRFAGSVKNRTFGSHTYGTILKTKKPHKGVSYFLNGSRGREFSLRPDKSGLESKTCSIDSQARREQANLRFKTRFACK